MVTTLEVLFSHFFTISCIFLCLNWALSFLKPASKQKIYKKKTEENKIEVVQDLNKE